MSESNTSAYQPADPSQPNTQKGSSARLVVLLCILAVALVAMGYDRLVARPAVDAAYSAIAAKNVEINATPNAVFTNTDVQDLIGRKPARTFTNPDGNTVEIYQWRSGLPIRTFDLYAIYTEMDGKLMFQETGTGDYDEIMKQGGGNSRKPTVVQLTEEDLAEMSRADAESNSMDGDAGMSSDARQEASEQAEEEQTNQSDEETAEPSDDAEESDSETEPTQPNEDPEGNKAETAEPEASEPEASEPEASEPEASEPEASEPEASEPEASATEPSGESK